MTQNTGITPRGLLESYRWLQDKASHLARETALCRKQARGSTVNAVFWQRREARLAVESGHLSRLINLRRQQLNDLLFLLPNEEQRQVLALRYISLMSYPDISKAIQFSLRHVYRLHNQGIEQLDALANTDSIL